MERPELDSVESIHLATVLEGCVDQLAILGRIMPVSYQDRFDASQIVGDEISQLVDGQRELERKYEKVLSKKQDLRGGGLAMSVKRAQAEKETRTVGGDLKKSTQVFSQSLRQSPLAPDTLEKVQADRGFVEHVLFGTMVELSQTGTFQSLSDAVRDEKGKKAKLQETIFKEEEGRKRVKTLQKQLVEVKKQEEVEVQQRDEMIAHLKDQLQEMKAKTNMEGKYIKRSAEVSVAQTQKRCNLSEKEMKNEIDQLHREIDEETRVNAEIDSYLRTHQADLELKVDYWMDKYDKDVEQKQHELDVLKASKAKDLERLQDLTKQYSEFEQVVVEDRIDKEKARRKAEQEAEELKAAIKVQAWFRGVMVRKGLGPFNKKKKKKGKKKKVPTATLR